MEFAFHPATESDRTYIRRLNFLTEVFGDEGRALGDDALDGVENYVDNWDPERDGGIIAFDEFRTPAGGVWLRYWQSPAEGHAFIRPDVPELAIAVENRYAGNALGEQLLQAACDLARSHGARQIALWVDPDNPRARHRYEKFGFTDADADNVMVLALEPGHGATGLQQPEVHRRGRSDS
ncbi:Ribosomal protein S18 acetylase RimI [Corynebacterium mycetoides]|uniref:Ribosomal protein S18 acetylase RimI n=1 Tax=Corynebacterium mycetoides TaxID=38302 RepID=A0A1G9QP61_9CORY|nr:GNAT family N-acetyltransferase [Corynebacterium mycetoides]SDM12776.1 Ribosomal protein S18 acetylase RimI [Corynebacterium mycetoides]